MVKKLSQSITKSLELEIQPYALEKHSEVKIWGSFCSFTED